MLHLNEEWTAERVSRSMWLSLGAQGRSPADLQLCPHCEGTYYRSNAGACPRCCGSVPLEPPHDINLHFGLV